MTQSLRAHFDGKVFVPDENVDLPAGSSVRLTVSDPSKESTTDNAYEAFLESKRQFLAHAEAWAQGAGPRDWKREDLYES